ncbi:MAG: M23 family metallopeptidase, partial [Clostridia bacterium]
NISSYFGMRILYNKPNFHNGIDIPAIENTKIYCIENGIIQYIGFDHNGYGNYIIVLHNNSYKSLYGHLSENMILTIGDKINKGQLLAYVGPKILSNGKSNGSTTGSHLHFTVYDNNSKIIDPLTLKYEK